MSIQRHEIAAVILMGGSGERMGGVDKALLTLGSHRILDKLKKTIAPQVGEVILNINGDPKRIGKTNTAIVDDGEYREHGPIAGILSAMRYVSKNRLASRNHVKYILSIPGDCPFLPTTLCDSLYDALQEAGDSMPSYARTGDQHHWLCALWPIALMQTIEQRLKLNDLSVKSCHRAFRSISAPFPNVDMFLNINTEQDLARARTLIHDNH